MQRSLYFAYGSNLDPEAMAWRCPDAEPRGRARLSDWALTFRGVADIERLPGAGTHGVLWRISARDLRRLDRYEGYPRLYRRELLAVATEQGVVEAIAYVMNDDYLGLPSPSYLETIRRGYERWELPIIALDRAVAMVRNRLYDRGVRRFRPDGPKRLRPA